MLHSCDEAQCVFVRVFKANDLVSCNKITFVRIGNCSQNHIHNLSVS